MMNSLKGSISYCMLQRLLEAAWDAGDTHRLLALSQAVDQHAIAAISQEMQKEIAI